MPVRCFKKKKLLSGKVELYAWYKSFLINVVVPHRELFGYLVSSGEILIGRCLVLGLLTRLSSIVGIFMLFNYYFGGMARGGAFPCTAADFHSCVGGSYTL